MKRTKRNNIVLVSPKRKIKYLHSFYYQNGKWYKVKDVIKKGE
jgi:hypothetical protein